MSRLSKLLDRLPIELFLIALVVLSYWRVQHLSFVYDDQMYIFAAQQTHHGLNLPDVTWALKSLEYANWHPLTWISYMVDSQMRGMVSLKQLHLTNLMIHCASMLLLFLLLNRLTKSVWKSAFVAALFGVHPIHVESVAWISERKDVLSTFFWLLTIWTYARYAETRKLKAYLATLACFILGLMSKPMIVTLPFTLLLVDYWPLGRLRTADNKQQTGDESSQPSAVSAQPGTRNPEPGTTPQLGLGKLIWEKTPFFVLAAASSALTYYAQSHGGAFGRVSAYPLSIRLMNAVYSYVMYIWKMIWPTKLAVLYPHPGYHLSVLVVAACLLLLIAITVLVLRAGKKAPYLPFGWLWYLGTLVPVIGIVQVGQQGMADRYTYVPLIGLFIIIAWGVPECVGVRGQGGMGEKNSHTPAPPHPRALVLSAVAVALILTLAVLTRIQVRYWRNNYTLFMHTAQVTKDNYEAHGNFGASLQEMGDLKGALREYETALKILPNEAPMHFNRGGVLMGLGRLKESEAEFRYALKLDPKYAPAHNDIATLLAKQGRVEEAFRHLDEAVKIEPNYADAYCNYGNLLDMVGRQDEALARYDDAIAVDPTHSNAHYNKGVLLYKLQRMDEAIAEYKEAIRLKPYNASAHKNLAMAYLVTGRYEEAWKEVHLVEKCGEKAHPGFIDALSRQMPDPGK